MSKKNRKRMLVFLVMGLTAVYGFSDMRHVFYDVLKEALHVNDLELGRLWSTFGIVAMLSYIGGGFLVDRIAPSKIISMALLLSGALHFLMSFAGNGETEMYPVLLGISAGMGFCAVFLFFPASSKILTTMSQERSGSILGKYYGFGGAITALVDLIATALYANMQDALLLFRLIMCFFAFVNVIAGLFMIVFFGDSSMEMTANERVRLADIPQVLQMKRVWIIAGLIFCNYLICCLMSYFTTYMTSEFGMSEAQALMIATIRLGIFCLLAGIIWGKWTDRIRSAKQVIRVSMILLSVLFLGLLANQFSIRGKVICVFLTFGIALVALGVKSIAFVLLTEEEIPPGVLGTVIGVVSFIGYSPDAILYLIAGKILETGESAAFAALLVIGLSAAIMGIRFVDLLKNNS